MQALSSLRSVHRALLLGALTLATTLSALALPPHVQQARPAPRPVAEAPPAEPRKSRPGAPDEEAQEVRPPTTRFGQRSATLDTAKALELYREREKQAAQKQRTHEAVTASRALAAEGDLAGAKARLLAEGVDQHSPLVRWDLAVIEQRENRKRPTPEQSFINRAAFFDDIQAQYGNKAASVEHKAWLGTLATVFAGREYLAQHGKAGETFIFKERPDGTQVSHYSTEARLKGKALKSLKSVPQDAVIYVQDHPSLNARDWTPQAVQTLDAAVSSGYEVRMLPPGPLAVFKPFLITEIATAREPVQYQRQSTEEPPPPPDASRFRNPCERDSKGTPSVEAVCRPVVLVGVKRTVSRP